MGLLQDVAEAFDSRVDIDWHEAAGGVTGGFSVNDVKYVLQLTPIVIEKLKVLEASFVLYDVQNDKGFATSGTTSTSPTAVYGVVANALIEKIPTLKCDAVFFSAERRHATDDEQHEAKLRIYKFAAQRIAKKLGWEMYTNKNEFLLTREYQGQSVKSFKHWQQELKEATGSSLNFPSLTRKHNV
jgi:hypothetical protein